MLTSLAVLFLLLNVGDVLTTWHSVRRQGLACERNPVMRWVMQQLGFWPTMVGKMGIATSAGTYYWWYGAAYPVVHIYLLGLVGVYLWVVGDNLRVVWQHRHEPPTFSVDERSTDGPDA